MSGTVIVGASSLAYFLGKLSYILGEDCMEKFIEQVYSRHSYRKIHVALRRLKVKSL